jgi:hypothetical protein
MNMVQYLGYIVDEHGVHVDLTKIQVIRDWPAPTTLTELNPDYMEQASTDQIVDTQVKGTRQQ